MRRLFIIMFAVYCVCGCDLALNTNPDPLPQDTHSDGPITPANSEPPVTPTESNAAQRAIIQKNGVVTLSPQFPYIGHKYFYDQTPGDNDLPWLRQYAVDHDVFAGVDLTTPWLDREWDMMKAIVYFTSHTLTFTGENTVPAMQFRAKDILQAAAAHPEYTWACGTVGQVAVALAQAHGIPARMINGRTLEEPCVGDYCCEMYSTHWNRWVFFMPHIGAWIEHQTDGPLGVAELHEYDSMGMIQVTLIGEQTVQVPDGLGGWNTVTFPEHWDAIPAPPLVFMPSTTNMAPIPPYRSVAWWSGWFHRFATSYTTLTQRQSPLMIEVFNDNLLNQLPCFTWNPLPVVAANDPAINHPLNNVEAGVVPVNNGFEIRLLNNMDDFVEYQARESDGTWTKLDVEQHANVAVHHWQSAPGDTLTLRGVNLAGVSSPEVVIVAESVTDPPP